MIYENDPLPLHHLKFMLCCGEKYNWKLLLLFDPYFALALRRRLEVSRYKYCSTMQGRYDIQMASLCHRSLLLRSADAAGCNPTT